MPQKFFPTSLVTASVVFGLLVAGLGLAGMLFRTPATAGPPDPTQGATQPVREQNLDDTGLIRVHEQGVADVNVTNTPLDVQGSVDIANFPTSIEVSNLPDVQDVEIVGGIANTALAPVTRAELLYFPIAPDITDVQSFSTVDATSVVMWAFDEAEVRIALGTPLNGERMVVLEDANGDIGWRQLTFVHPLPVRDVQVSCFNESDNCFVRVWVMGH
jgi:hypothetical protein